MRFCVFLGGLEGFGGARKPAWPSLAVSGRVDFLGGPTAQNYVEHIEASLLDVCSDPQT